MREGCRFWTFLAAGVVLLFTAGPVLLTFAASVIPNRVLFDERGTFR